MLERMSICFFHPRMIGKFLSDSWLKITLFFLFFFSLSMVPYLTSTRNYIKMDSTVAKLLISDIETAKSDITFDGKVLSGTIPVVASQGELRVSFLSKDVLCEGYVLFEYTEEQVHIKMEDKIVYSYIYESYDLTRFDFSKLNGDFNQKQALNSFLNLTYEKIARTSYPVVLVQLFFYNLLINIGIVLMAFLLNLRTNPILPKAIILKVAMLSTVVSFAIDLIVGLFNIPFLSYIGMILPVVYTFLALKSIVRIKG